MNLSSSGLLAYARTEEARKKLRYAGVSALFVPVGQGLIAGLRPVARQLHRRVAAGGRHPDSPQLLRQQALRLAGHVPREPAQPGARVLGGRDARRLAEPRSSPTSSRTRWPVRQGSSAAQPCSSPSCWACAIVWVGRFLILDRWLFKLAGDTPEHTDAVIGAGCHRVSNRLTFQERDSEAAEKTDIADED